MASNLLLVFFPCRIQEIVCVKTKPLEDAVIDVVMVTTTLQLKIQMDVLVIDKFFLLTEVTEFIGYDLCFSLLCHQNLIEFKAEIAHNQGWKKDF